jgi:hypothetical protein
VFAPGKLGKARSKLGKAHDLHLVIYGRTYGNMEGKTLLLILKFVDKCRGLTWSGAPKRWVTQVSSAFLANNKLGNTGFLGANTLAYYLGPWLIY